MKVKLLKKIRKRYEIIHYPDGLYIGDTWFNGPYTAILDNQDNIRWKGTFSNKKEGYQYCMEILRDWIQEDYKTSRKKKYYKIEKLWWK